MHYMTGRIRLNDSYMYFFSGIEFVVNGVSIRGLSIARLVA